MKNKIKVLIVDDSIVTRRIVSDIINSDGDIEVCATAANGIIGLEKIELVNPDVVILDLEMPEMNGLNMLRALRKKRREIPVIMFSVHTSEGASATFEALASGANDFVQKPVNVGNLENVKKNLIEELIPKIKSLYAISVQDKNDKQPFILSESDLKKNRSDINNQRIEALIIGSSTGGPNALAKLIADIPSDIGVPVLIVQHMPPLFTKLLAERLASKSKIGVFEAVSGMTVEKNNIYIAPGDFHMTVKKEGNAVKIQTNKDEQENSCRPSVDVLFRSAAEVYGCNILAVILTGMGHDGLKGCAAVKKAGGRIFVQDKETSVVPSMPGSVSSAGLSDGVFPIDSIGCEIVKKVREANALSDMLRRV